MEQNIATIRKILKEQILANKKLFGYEEEHNQLFDLLRRTIENGESNSMLLIGPRGVGKTTLVNNVLEDLKKIPAFKNDSILVKLHGLIHTDDRLALKSIAFQMNLDNAIDGKVFGSFAESLAFLLTCLRTGEKQTSKSVIFVLEEFDLFCAHHNQTLLYNLFDVSQSAQAPICVLGVTSRYEVIVLLEKRVKSRFSHRQMFLYPGQVEDSNISDLDHALDRLRCHLEIPEKSNYKIPVSAKKQWNCHVNNILQDKKFRNVIERLIDLDLKDAALKNLLVKSVFELSESSPTLKIERFEKELSYLERDEIILVLQDLSVLELCLLVAMKHHYEIYDGQPMNFEMVYTRFIKFANKHSGMQNVQRAVVMKAFEHIERIELIAMLTQGVSRVQKEYQFFKLLVTPKQISEAVTKNQGLPTELVQWATTSLL